MPQTYTGAWRRQQVSQWQDRPGRGLAGTVPDTQHSTPDPNYGDAHPDWEMTGARLQPTPVELVDDQYGFFSLSPGYTVDQSPYGDHTDGVGFGAGLSTQASMAQVDPYHHRDRGETAQRRYAAPVGREAGNSPRMARYQAEIPNVDSPGSTQLHRQAQPDVSPGARLGYRTYRTTDRIFGFFSQSWANDHRPRVTTVAFTAPNVPAPTPGAAATTPYASQAPVRVVRTIAPQQRRAPRPWDEAVTTDGSDATPESLSSWGL